MPFSSLRDPSDMGRARSAMQRAWSAIAEKQIALGGEQLERDRLALIIVGLLPNCSDEDELVERALDRFAQAGAEP